MRQSIIRELTLYRYRYFLGFGLFLVALCLLLSLRLDLAPSGISQAEMDSATYSAAIDLPKIFSQQMVDLPYHLVQKFSLKIFGVTEFAIILPSILFALVTGIVFLSMVKRWFRYNVAIITGFIFITSAAFLTLGRTGTPEIMPTFWLSVMLLITTNIVHPRAKTSPWFAAGIIVLPFSLYTPLMIYPYIAAAIAGTLHPHVRFALRRIKPTQYLLGSIYLIVVLVPLIASFTAYPQQITTLLGLPEDMPSLQDIAGNMQLIFQSIFGLAQASVGSIPRPLFGAASLILIILGIMRAIADRYSARSYILFAWCLLIAPFVIIDPSKLLIYLVPLSLFLAIGVQTIIYEWYKLFPSNPYARIAGLIPLTILLLGIVFSNYIHYFDGHYYSVPTTRYTLQLEKTKQLLETKPYNDSPVTLIVAPDHEPFYSLLKQKMDKLSVSSSIPRDISQPTIVHSDVDSGVITQAPSRIVTSYRNSSDQVVLRIFTP